MRVLGCSLARDPADEHKRELREERAMQILGIFPAWYLPRTNASARVNGCGRW